MIILNACSTIRIALNDSQDLPFFSVNPDPNKNFQMHLLDGVITDEDTACFLRDFPIEWLKKEKQVMGVRIEAPNDVCRNFLKSRVVNAKVLFNDEESAF